MKYPRIFEPLEIRGVRFKNRTMALPLLFRRDARPESGPTADCAAGYEQLAAGGVAAVTVAENFPAPASVAEREPLLILTECIRCHDSVPGLLIQCDPAGDDAAALRAAIASCADTAGLAAGLGYRLLVLSGLYRPEAATGDPVRHALNVLKAVRAAAGPGVVLACELACSDASADEYVSFCAMAESELDLVVVKPELTSSEFDDHGLILPLCARFKAALRLPVAAAGGFNDPRQLENALLSGQCDMIAMSRQLLADPAFVAKTAEAREAELTPCLRCGACEPGAHPSEPLQCAVNPRALRGARLQLLPAPRHRQRVLVVGGGPAGMFAALTAVGRGHEVRLAEKEKRLGGLLWFAGESSRKEDLRRFRDSLIKRLHDSGVEICTGVAVGRDYISKYAPDAVILAIGAEPGLSPIPGLAVFAHSALWAYSNPDKVGGRVVVIGGGLTGLDCALHLADRPGCEVTVLESAPDCGGDAYPSQRAAIERCLPPSVRITTGARCTEVRPGGVTYRAKNGRRVEVEADTVLYAVGMHSRRAELAELLQAHPNTRIIGNCREPGRILEALRDALYAAIDIT